MPKVLHTLWTAALFAAIVTPLGVVMRAAGRTPLGLRRDPRASTYWIDHRPRAQG